MYKRTATAHKATLQQKPHGHPLAGFMDKLNRLAKWKRSGLQNLHVVNQLGTLEPGTSPPKENVKKKINFKVELMLGTRQMVR